MGDARGLGGLFVAAGPPLRQPPLARSLCCRLMASALNRYARASGIAPAAFVGFSPVSGCPPPLAQMAASRGEKACAPAPRLPAPPLWPRPAGTPGQASAGGPFGRLPPSHFLVSVAVGSSGATPPPPPRRPVSPAHFGAPGRGFFSFAAAGIDIVAEATPGHYMLWCVICNTSQYRRPDT